MSDTPRYPRRKTPFGLVLLALLLLGAGGILYVIGSAVVQPGADQGLERFARGSLQKMQTPPAPGPAFTGAFADASGRTVRVADVTGRVTVVNLWATWCAPCVAEMPTLAALQRAYAAQGLRVVPISLDIRAAEPNARAFIGRHPPLSFHHDPLMATFNSIWPRPLGLPVTIVYDAQGRERARLAGDGDWNSAEARGLIEALLAEAGAPAAQAPDRPS